MNWLRREIFAKNGKKEIKEALDEWKTEGKLYLANHLLHGVWKK
jgi:hypothetical protein